MRRVITILIFALLGTVVAQGQIKIGGNVYGGGNQAVVKGTSSVTVKAGDIGAVLDEGATRPLENPNGKVFGGARMANVGGYSYVHIDGEHATDYILVNHVYGGNDIAGQVGTAKALNRPMPEDSLTAIKRSGHAGDETDPKRNAIDDTYNSYVRISTKTDGPGIPATDAKKVYIGQLFGGGNGEYDYEQVPAAGGKVTHYIYNKSDTRHENPVAEVTTDPGDVGFQLPEQDKTYLEVLGGSIVYGYGGGNNATVKTQNVIHYDNPSKVVNHILVSTAEETKGQEADAATYTAYEASIEAGTPVMPSGYVDLLTTIRFKEMGINTTFSQPSSGEFQVGRFFGGNNLAEMNIRPTWNLLSGKIRNLYSGGNRGAMTSPEGLLLEIKDYSTLVVDNLYGGCRMADVMPTVNGVYVPCTNLPGYKFPDGFSARVRVLGGDINNIYGGNDVTGTVYGGNAVGVYTSIRGDIYGGGNGAYPYTDNASLANSSTFGDFYYDIGSLSSTDALKAFRPNAEQVSIRLFGTEATPTLIKGSVYLGGNCASLATKVAKPTVELKMGSHVIVNNVFLGNNGAGMVNPDYLKLYAGKVDENGDYTVSDDGTDFSSMELRTPSVMAEYMDAVTMTLQPSIEFDKVTNGDPDDYIDFSSYVGSFYCGGNVGSMGIAGKNVYRVDRGLNIFEKFVGGCNNANVPEGDYNAAFEGGVIGTEDERDSYTEAGKIKDRLEINLENMTITPLRWNDDKTQLMWNTNKWDNNAYFEIEAGTELAVGEKYYTEAAGVYTEHTVTGTSIIVPDNVTYYEKGGFVEVPRDPSDRDIRLLGGNVYGGCYESGHVNGNVVININQELLNKDKVFGNSLDGVYSNPASGVEVEDQRDDLMAVALSVFGAGYGEQTEIWGSTTVNHNNGYAFQIYGGGELGVVGKPRDVVDEHGIITGKEYYFDPAFSSTVNLNGASAIYSNDGTAEDLAETEYIYGGGNEGDVCGNTYVNLGNGRIYDAFGGACDADIFGHTEVIIGRQPNGSGGYKLGFPWIRDIVYGGNDFGGEIKGAYEDGFDYKPRIRDYEAYKTQMHGYAEGKHEYMLKASSYVEYLQGRVDTIFGGSYGYYDYTNTALYGEGCSMPRQESAFVNLRPVSNDRNSIAGVFGAGTGYPGNREDDKAQDHSYVLVDLTDENNEGFKNMEVFGAGSYNGVGMREEKTTTFAPGYDLEKVSAVVDLLHGEIGNAYGGSYREGNTARTVVNVPEESNIKVKNIFGGAYGVSILPPCDVILANVNYKNTSEKAVVTGAIYGGNNNQRRSIFTNVNISSPVWSDKAKGYLATAYGAGKGFNSWSEHTNVNLLSGGRVYEVYGGGEMGHVLNAETVQQYMQNEKGKPSVQICEEAPWNDKARWVDNIVGGTLKSEYEPIWAKAWIDAWSLGDYYSPIVEEDHEKDFKNYFDTFAALRSTSLVRKGEIDERDYTGYDPVAKAKRQYIYNTNVIINEGAEVVNYAYGGGYGSSSSPFSGDVWGHTYIALLGGKVRKDIYAAGTAGAVDDAFATVGAYNASTNPFGFTASATAYIKGGTCRNVYGGGWEGNVGFHSGDISASPAADLSGETYVVIGDLNGSSFTDGIPAIQRNAYGGGEGGAVYGTAHIKLNKGYIGYKYNSAGIDDVSTTNIDERYEKNIEDETKETPNTLLTDAGNLFGGGYIDNSTVDKTQVILNGGVVRSSVFGGGEIAAIGRGDMVKGGGGYELNNIYRPGKTNVEMYKGYVMRNVYGGGRGYDNLGRVGTLNCAGYVFGQTEVHIHGGEIGTVLGLADGDGNVFGGGDIGVVYSAYEKPDGSFGVGKKKGYRYDGIAHSEGYYYKYENGGYVTGDLLTEDCKVVVEPMPQVLNSVTIDGHDYVPGQFVPTDTLNMLKDKNSDESKWSCLDLTGIVIHNAVFAGGNAQPGSVTTGANINTVYGNATASINDVFHRDMITLGTRHTGGLYGDGNLTLVDGYRELNITNYGTDYYSIAKEIDINTYHNLPDREAAYYELNYTCTQECKDKYGNTYLPKATITADDMLDLFLVYNEDTEKYVSYIYGGQAVLQWDETEKSWKPNPAAGYWEESGVLPVYAGRLMNSIQRADFCGVFGSRMVMQGAQDRVPEEADYTNYTINRVREVSLNMKETKISDEKSIPESSVDYYNKRIHGNYFGIYNVVNHLGALTSDVRFSDVRKTDNTNEDYKTASKAYTGGASKPYGEASFYDWKAGFVKERKRNNGNSHNKVALASGVYLEITTEKSTGTDLHEKDWGPITGVVELDLINVSPGIGGGFVYAKNIHGIPTPSGAVNTTLTTLNQGAVTQWDYTYETTDDAAHQMEWESSGNFVHSTQTIIDDCYNISNRYYGAGKMPAHFWYIKGSTYVYDQYISAYTGQPNAYSEVAEIPLTIAAASHGKMKLLNVMPSRYAYYAKPGEELGEGKKMIINGNTYYKNDPISYWDWYLLSSYEKELFVEKTYTNCITCKIDGVEYAAGTYIMTDAEFATYMTTFPAGKTKHEYTDADNQPIKDADDNEVGDSYIFRESNNVSHDKGYILTYEVNNPSQWDNWYTPKSNTTEGGKITLADYEAKDVEGKALYEDGPTYHLKAGIGNTMLGQSEYEYGDLIPEAVQTTYTTAYSRLTDAQKAALATQAAFEEAYIVKNKITIHGASSDTYYNVGTTVPASFAAEHSSDCEPAYICTRTIELTKDNFIYKDSKMTYAEKEALETSYPSLADDIHKLVVPAYFCKTAGLYGGNYYESNHNYRGLEAWSAMSAADRKKFTFNYDALDLLIDSLYSKNEEGVIIHQEGQKYQYDSPEGTWEAAKANKAQYSLVTPVDYTAEYNSDTPSKTLTNTVIVKRAGESTPTDQLVKGDELVREEFEDKLVNEQRYYSTIAVKEAGTYYVVNTPFQIGSTPYAVGETISSETYTSLSSSEKENVTSLTFTEEEKNKNFYYCREAYEIITAHKVKSIKGENTSEYATGETVLVGAIIAAGNSGDFTGYEGLTNEQLNFTIHGISPTETSTLYVSRESNIYDLSKEKIITVIYQYDYDETDASGNVTPVSERHVLNIHLSFKSGVPVVEDITPPEIILPGDLITMREPTVTPGAYEVTGGGWELFATQRDAESHTNGVEHNPNVNKLYWYQDEYYLAYYAKSYLGRTYSNAVPVRVANYHDMADVMSDESHHMYIDHKNVKRDSKIYINDYSASSKNGLDIFKNLYDLSLVTKSSSSSTDGYTVVDGVITEATGTANTSLVGHSLLDGKVRGGKDLEFFLRTDIDHTKPNPDYDPDDPESPERIPDPWTSIASGSDPCFQGTLHGDGHTVSGLDNSLFGHLCGSVYNLGVTGSFNSAGVADDGEGYVESCWVKTSATTPLGSKPYAVFGDPSDDKGYQVVNSYFWDGNNDLFNTSTEDGVTTSGGARGKSRAMTTKEFYNGTVAYDLNNFYLYKRYSDKAVTSGSENEKYSYFTIGNDDKLVLQNDHYYTANANLCSTGHEDNNHNVIMYVEDRFADGDFRYAGGTIPETEDERYYTWKVDEGTEDEKEESSFFPIWPDDYIFFGQKLTYGWASVAHQDVPTAVARDGGRLSSNDDANRVYRAPAYFRSKVMGVAHFNPAVYLAQNSYDGTKEAYPGMTAIDFAGHYGAYPAYGAYNKGNEGGLFYTPLLDDDGLTSIQNCDETQNLLVYAPAASGDGYINAKTHGVLNSYFVDPAYTDYHDATSPEYSDGKAYNRVADASGVAINGHLVQHNLEATNDHLLVDKQDFNAPLEYTFAANHLMWYQRKPGLKEYVDLKTGWQGISLPFTAELVTTDAKGEITHFYSGSETSKNGTGSKIGHEYWLRELTNNATMTEKSSGILEANFHYPAAAGAAKEVANTFLWDYYYKNTTLHDQKDANADIYLQYKQYYSTARNYSAYPFLTASIPYILGLPGSIYYEFDLSGKFEAKHTAVPVPKLNKQVVTFASNKAATIHVSDDEMTGVTVKYNGTNYTFKPSYMNESLAAGTSSYVMDADGDSYDKVPAEGDATMVSAFRPYFVSAAIPSSSTKTAKAIIFSGDYDGLIDEPLSVVDGTLEIYTREHNIVTTSHLQNPVTITVVSVAGITYANYVLPPGETIETPVRPGVYIVNRKKLLVKP